MKKLLCTVVASSIVLVGTSLRAAELPTSQTMGYIGNADILQLLNSDTCVTIISDDGLPFYVTEELAKTFETIRNCMEDCAESRIFTANTVSGGTLDKLLELTCAIAWRYFCNVDDYYDYYDLWDASTQECIDLLLACDFLHSPQILVDVVMRALKEKMTFKKPELNVIFGSGRLPHDVTVEIMQSFARRAQAADVDELKALYTTIYQCEEINLDVRLLLIKEIVIADLLLRTKFLGKTAVHAKTYFDDSLDPMPLCLRMPAEPVGERERSLVGFLENLLRTEHYQWLLCEICKEYAVD